MQIDVHTFTHWVSRFNKYNIFCNLSPFFRSLEQPCYKKEETKERKKNSFTIIDKLFDFVVVACLFVSRCVRSLPSSVCLDGCVAAAVAHSSSSTLPACWYIDLVENFLSSPLFTLWYFPSKSKQYTWKSIAILFSFLCFLFHTVFLW